MTRPLRNQTLVDQILALPGVDLPILRQAMYQWKKRHGQCAKGNRCPNPPMKGLPFCEYHTNLQREAEARFQKGGR